MLYLLNIMRVMQPPTNTRIIKYTTAIRKTSTGSVPESQQHETICMLKKNEGDKIRRAE